MGKVALLFVGNASVAASQFVLLSLFIRFGGLAEGGVFGLALAVTAPVFLTAALGMRVVFLTHKSIRDFRYYLGVRVSTSAISIVIVSIVASIFFQDVMLSIMLVAAIKSLDSILDIYFGLFRQREQIRRMSWIMISNSCFTAGAGGLCYFLTREINWALVASVCSSIVVLAWVLATTPVRKGSKFRFVEFQAEHPLKTKIGFIVAAGLPLGIASGIASVATGIPTYFLSVSGGLAMVGAFTTLYYVITAANLFYTSVAQYAVKNMSDLVRKAEFGGLRTIVLQLAGTGIAFGVLIELFLLLFGENLFIAVYGEDFVGVQTAVSIIGISVALIPVSCFLDVALSSLNYYYSQLSIGLVTLFTTATVAVLLIPTYGLVGACWTSVSVMLMRSLLKTYVFRRGLRTMALKVYSDNRVV